MLVRPDWATDTGTPVGHRVVAGSDFAPLASGEINGACRSWNERDGGGLATLPDDLEGAVPALEAQILDVGLACFGHAESVEAEQHSERSMVAVEALGGEQEHTELGAIQSPRLSRMHLW